MSVFDWSQSAAQNATADASIPATDTMSGRQYAASVRNLMAQVARYAADQGGVLALALTDNAYEATTASGISELRAGISLVVRADRTNTAESTLDVDGTGPKFWRDMAGVDLPGGAIQFGRFYRVFYDLASDTWRS